MTRWMVTKTFLLSLALAAPAAAAPPPEIFAVIVTNNQSTSLERPDLQYADDDGARYFEMFRGVAAPSNVVLLTRFDRSSEAAYPALKQQARPPLRAGLRTALGEIQERVKAARAAGRRSQFYFVYAGHGDVVDGAGFLDLEDGRIDSRFLEEEVVSRVSADVHHIVLDSCNSFFVVNPRKPGGRRWATPKDMALGFARRHPQVGLFLSTNSEAEVYEWSELESGIFSHEVRSGLSGAADANADGDISYAELAAFVDRANAGLPRANLRPQIFYRGPDGNGGAALFNVAAGQGRRITLDGEQRRLWVRGADGERLIDLHKEPGPLTILIPGRNGPLSIIESLRPDAQSRPVLREFEIPAGTEPVSLGSLTPGPLASTARGGAVMFGQLFNAPFGPRAYASFVGKSAAAEEPVYGLSAQDELRMRHYLNSIATSDTDTARMQGAIIGTTGALFVGMSIASYWSEPKWDGSFSGIAITGGIGLVALAGGLKIALSKPLGVQARDAFENELRQSPTNRALALAKTESHLDELSLQESRYRRRAAWWTFGAAASLAFGMTWAVVEGDRETREPISLVAGYGTVGLLGAVGALIYKSEMPTERLLRLYRTDPDLGQRLQFGLLPGGARLSLRGTF